MTPYKFSGFCIKKNKKIFVEKKYDLFHSNFLHGNG